MRTNRNGSMPVMKRKRKMSAAQDAAYDRSHGIKPGSARDNALDRRRGIATKSKKKSFTVKQSGSYNGKSNALGHGGRAAQMRAHGVPGGVIGAIARSEGAAPGGPNYHGPKPGSKGKKSKVLTKRNKKS